MERFNAYSEWTQSRLYSASLGEIIRRMWRWFRRIFKATVLVIWLGMVIAALVIWSGYFAGDFAPVWSFERREISDRSVASGRRSVVHAEVAGFAAKADGACVFYRGGCIRKNRGVLQITATSMAYGIDDGVECYYLDHGNAQGVFFNHSERNDYRFPMSWEDWTCSFYTGEWISPPNHRLRYTFVRTAYGGGRRGNIGVTGWDLDVRIPFWLIFLVLGFPAGMVGGWKTLKLMHRRRRRARRRCERCGYDLRGLSSARCPECGEAFVSFAGSQKEA